MGLGSGRDETDSAGRLWGATAVLLAVEDGSEVGLSLSLALSNVNQDASIESQLNTFVKVIVLAEMQTADIVVGVVV